MTKQQSWQQLNLKHYEKDINEWEMNEGGKSLDKNILNVRYADKPNLLTDKVYILSD